MNRILILAISLIPILSLSGQSKKELKENKIKSATEWNIKYENGKAVTYKAVYEEFDKYGHSTLKIEYDPGGVVLTKMTSKYDSYKNKVVETEYDALKKKDVKRVSRYNAFNDKTEESEYNSSGVLQKKTTFTYNAAGDKSSEIIYDGSGALLKKTTYTYNTKKMKTGRQTVDKNNIPESGKKWEYEYY